ncbi:MAG: extracellular solute-binding protein [Phycisphaerales bacterium]|nr:extracellular solute-binding protein [Phycisphaerales bacterium]
MKYLFAGLFLVIVGLSVLTALSLPNSQSDVPIFYWVTDKNPARTDQVRLFHQWMLTEGHTKEFTLDNADHAKRFIGRNIDVVRDVADSELQPQGEQLQQLLAAHEKGQAIPDSIQFPVKVLLPEARLALDMANRDPTKQIIQSVSGVAGDVQDIGSMQLPYFQEIGVTHDLTEWGKELHFDPSRTYPALLTDITVPDQDEQLHQYLFPCNVTVGAFIINKEAFRQWGQPIPPRIWSLEEFERRGKAFVEAANKGQARRTVFFANGVPTSILWASLGGARFNETNTGCTLDSPACIKALELAHKWMFVDHLVPTAADTASFSSDSGYGGLIAQMFNNNEHPERGQIGMMYAGRYLLIEFRKYDQVRKERGQPLIDYGLSEAPNGGFRNGYIMARGAFMYEGSPNKELAKYFLQFLASKPYNMQIVKDADGLPPDPQTTQTEEYLRPPDHPNEWELHEGFAQMANEIAIGESYSPFILSATADRIMAACVDKYMQQTPLEGFETAARTMAVATSQINDEMQRTITENPQLKPLYDKLMARQQRIDDLKQRITEFETSSPGQAIPEDMRIPLKWINNPFHQAYYKHKGWVK